jgi:hypothetical protein
MLRALCVGVIDYPVRGADLNGCVNDAKAWAKVLSNEYGFPSGDIRLLLNKEATKKGVTKGIDKLLAGAKNDDVLVLAMSGHGTYLADTSGDEERYDEAFCPWDMKTDLIVDDELHELFGNLASGCRLTVISDSCFSGTLTRLAWIRTPDDRRKKFVRPKTLGLPELRDPLRAKPKKPLSESSMREVLVAACRDFEEAIDARFGPVHHGAMTFFALEILRAANYDLTYRDFWDRLVVRLEDEGFPQEPQVEGKASAKRRRMFT